MSELVGHRPKEIVVGGGVVLKPITVGDSEEMFDLVKDNLGCIDYYLRYIGDSYTSADSWRRKISTESDTYKGFGIRDIGTLVGSIGVDDRGDREWRLSYWVGPQHQRKGYAAQAVLALTRHTFEELGGKTITAVIHEANAKSRGLVEKTGFVLDGYYFSIPNHVIYRLDKPRS